MGSGEAGDKDQRSGERHAGKDRTFGAEAGGARFQAEHGAALHEVDDKGEGDGNTEAPVQPRASHQLGQHC